MSTKEVFTRVSLLSRPRARLIDTDFRYFPPKDGSASGGYSFHHRQIEFCGDDYTDVVPPDPISNSEVKYIKADGSLYWRE